MRIRAIKSFVWHGPRDVDVGDVLEVPDREAFLLIEAYGYCVRLDEAAPQPSPAAMVVSPDPAVQFRDPVAVQVHGRPRRRG